MTPAMVVVLYGTESGNAELVAEEVVEAIETRVPAEMVDMSDPAALPLLPERFYLVVCSTHGDGELPTGALPFAEALDRDRPSLDGVRYAMFGLGDSSYETYSRGSELIDERLAALGASRTGSYGRHDASSRDVPSDLAIAWANEVLDDEPLLVGHLVGQR